MSSGSRTSSVAKDLALIFLVAAGMCWWTWGTWPDPLVDWGTQLYMVWQVTLGKVLYRDVHYQNGPLSVYFNAGIVSIFGMNQRVLWWTNLAILACVIVMFYTLLRTLGGRVPAVIGNLVFVLVFAFSQYTSIANYNFVTPYMQEVTHGLALDLAGLCCLVWFQRRPRSILPVAVAGLCVGLCFLTKAEVFVGGVAAVIGGFAIALWQQRLSRMRMIAAIATFFACTVAPFFVALGYFASKMPVNDAARGILGTFPWMLDSRIAQMSFYRWMSGFDDVGHNVLLILLWSAGAAVLFGALAYAAMRVRRSDRIVFVTSMIVVAIPLLIWAPRTDAGRPLPLIMLAFLVLALRDRTKISPLRVAMILLGGGLLLKIPLYARMWHYGFVLALPATLLVVEALLNWIPARIRERGGSSALFAGASVGALIALVGARMLVSELQYLRYKTLWIGSGPDSFLVDPRSGGREIEWALGAGQHIPPAQTLALVPQGLMVNYLLRVPNSYRYLNLMEPEVVTTGEQAVLDDIRNRPPDFILLTLKDLNQNPSGFRLQDDVYGEVIWRWMLGNYEQVGAPPPNSGPLGLILLRRKPQHP